MSQLYKQTTRDAYFLAATALEHALRREIIDDMLNSEVMLNGEIMSKRTDEEKQAIKKAIGRLAKSLAKRAL